MLWQHTRVSVSIYPEDQSTALLYCSGICTLAMVTAHLAPCINLSQLLLACGGMLAGGPSQDAIMTGIEKLMRWQEAIQAVLAERLIQTRQASTIDEAELRVLMTAARCRAVWDADDPTLMSLLGPAPEEGTASWWYVFATPATCIPQYDVQQACPPCRDEAITEPEQRDACAAELQQHFLLTHCFCTLQTVELTVNGAPFPVAGKSDELISLTHFLQQPSGRRHHGRANEEEA